MFTLPQRNQNNLKNAGEQPENLNAKQPKNAKKCIALYSLFRLADKTADLANYTIFQKINTKYALTIEEKLSSKSRDTMQNAKSFSSIQL